MPTGKGCNSLWHSSPQWVWETEMTQAALELIVLVMGIAVLVWQPTLLMCLDSISLLWPALHVALAVLLFPNLLPLQLSPDADMCRLSLMAWCGYSGAKVGILALHALALHALLIHPAQCNLQCAAPRCICRHCNRIHANVDFEGGGEGSPSASMFPDLFLSTFCNMAFNWATCCSARYYLSTNSYLFTHVCQYFTSIKNCNLCRPNIAKDNVICAGQTHAKLMQTYAILILPTSPAWSPGRGAFPMNPIGPTCVWAYLRANFLQVNFLQVNFPQVNFPWANFLQANFLQVNFAQANFMWANFLQWHTFLWVNFLQVNFLQVNFLWVNSHFLRRLIFLRWLIFCTG